MTPEEYRWNIRMVQDRYEHLQLNEEQAQKVYQYEQNNLMDTGFHSFSTWEEWDYERTIFEKILSKQQFEIYAKRLDDWIEKYVAGFPAMDKDYQQQVAYTREVLQYCQAQFIPAVTTRLPFSLYFRNDVHKISFLKAAYKQYWLQTRQRSLISHFREYKLYMPTALQYILWQHQVTTVWPDYCFFRSGMDATTSAVDADIRSKVSLFTGEADQVLQKKLEEKTIFLKALQKKYYKKDKGGWHVVIDHSKPEEEKTDRLMTLLLVDQELYQFTEIMLA